MVTNKKNCLVCEEGVDATLVEQYQIYSIYQCPKCGLHFSEPLDYRPQEYEMAFRGESQFSDLGYVARLNSSGKFPLYNFERMVLQWLGQHLKPGDAVLDLGCGAGVFLHHLKKVGFQSLGLDITPSSIEKLHNLGFAVAVGSIDSYPSEWPEPKAIVMLEVLEHLPNPLEFVKKVNSYFPRSYLLLSVPSLQRWSLRKGKREEGDYPPHHLTRWTPRALSVLLEKSGYSSKVVFPAVSPQHISGTGVGKLFLRWFVKIPMKRGGQAEGDRPNSKNFYHDRKITIDRFVIEIKRILFWPVITLLSLRGFSDISMLAIGIPQKNE